MLEAININEISNRENVFKQTKFQKVIVCDLQGFAQWVQYTDGDVLVDFRYLDEFKANEELIFNEGISEDSWLDLVVYMLSQGIIDSDNGKDQSKLEG